MMRALFSGVTGLRSHQTRMDVIGNNIANVNTVGFKKSAVNFGDLYSETISPASAPSANNGGINAQQVGLGVGVNSIVIKHSPGAAQYTGNTLDLAITGDGFFTVRTTQGNRFTRAGNFSISSNGSLVNPEGNYVQCLNSNYRTGTAGAATERGWDGKTTKSFTNLAFANDANIVATPAGTYTFELKADNTIKVMRNGLDISPTPPVTVTGAPAAGNWTDNTTYSFDVPGVGKFSFDLPNGTVVTMADGFREIGSLIDQMSVVVSNNDGFVSGNTLGDMIIDRELYENITINKEGAVIAQLKQQGVPAGIGNAISMGKGEKVILGYVALANFTNVEGLEKESSNLYQTTANSGMPTYNTAGTGGTGLLTPSSLEMSNVDLSEEMVTMITTQRGFQANSRIITTTDSMLEELVNLKR